MLPSICGERRPLSGSGPETTFPPKTSAICGFRPGFAHGFVVLTDSAEFLYKTTDYWAPEHERCIRWDDPALGIRWPLEGAPQISAKDAQGASFAAAEVFP